MNIAGLLHLLLRTLSQLEFEGGSTVTAGIEFCSVEKGAGVMHCNEQFDSAIALIYKLNQLRPSTAISRARVLSSFNQSYIKSEQPS